MLCPDNVHQNVVEIAMEILILTIVYYELLFFTFRMQCWLLPEQ